MLKCAGILFILTGAFGFGGYMDACLKWHLDQLIGCREIFAQINAYREYLKLPYGELIRRSAIGKSGVLPEILTEVAVEMGKNREANVGALWEEAFFKRKKQLYLKEEEIGILLALAKCRALEGNHAQACSIYFMQLEDTIRQAMEEKKDKQKLYRAISVLGGLFLVVLLL